MGDNEFLGYFFVPEMVDLNNPFNRPEALSPAVKCCGGGAYSPFSICCPPPQLPMIKPKTKANERIGPHNQDVISVIIGSMLGDSYGEKHGKGTRFVFQQEESNMEYLVWFHKFFEERGYCTNLGGNRPKVSLRLGKNGKIRYYYRFRTFTFTSFDWILEAFYPPGPNQEKGVKVVPVLDKGGCPPNACPHPAPPHAPPSYGGGAHPTQGRVGGEGSPPNPAGGGFLDKYLTPLALAIWIQDDGGKLSAGLKIATNGFTLRDVEILCKVLNDKYQLSARPQSAGVPNQYIIYFPKKSMNTLSKLVKPYMIPSMHYKLNGY